MERFGCVTGWECSCDTQRFILVPSGVWPAGARWTTQSPHHHNHHPRSLSSKPSLSYSASISEDLEVRKIELVFPGFGNTDIWPLPAGLRPPETRLVPLYLFYCAKQPTASAPPIQPRLLSGFSGSGSGCHSGSWFYITRLSLNQRKVWMNRLEIKWQYI